MIKVNKVIILFTCIVSLSLVGVWSTIQSEAFSKFLSTQITKTIQKNSNYNIEFNNVEVKLFPPATIINKVKFKEGENLILETGSLGLYFGLLDFFSDKLSISEIVIVDANLYLSESDDLVREKRTYKIEDLFNDFTKTIVEKLPIKVKRIETKRTVVFYGDDFISLKNSRLNLYDSLFDVSFNINKIKMNKYDDFIKLLSIDSFSGRLQLTKDKLWIKNTKLKSRLDSFNVDGLIFNKNKKIISDLNLSFIGDIQNYQSLFKSNHHFDGLKGYLKIESNVKSIDKSVEIKSSVSLDRFYSKYFFSEKIKLKTNLKNNILKIEKASVQHHSGSAKLTSAVEIFDISNNEILTNPINLSLDSIATNQALYSLNDILENFKGLISGDVSILWTGKEVTFDIKNGATLKNFRLNSNSSKIPILINKKIVLGSSKIIILEDDGVSLDLDLSLNRTKLKANGVINSNGISIIANNSYVDLHELGPISGSQLIGDGRLSFDIYGPFDDVKFKFDVGLSDFSVLKFQLGRVKSEFEYSLNSGILNIQRGIGVFNDSMFSAFGKIDFLKEDIALDIDVENSTLIDSWEIYKPIVSKFDWSPEEIRATIKSSYKVRGKIRETEIKVFGNIKISDIRILEEDIDKVNLHFNYNQQIMTVTDLYAQKGSGVANGKFTYNLVTEYFEYDASLANLKLDDLTFYRIGNFGLDGIIKGDIYGNGTVGDFSSRAHVKLENSLIGSQKVEDSFLTIYNNSQDVYLSANILGEQAKFNSYLNFDDKNSQLSHVKAEIKTSKLKEVFGVISEHNISDESLFGKVDIDLESTFDINDWRKANLSLSINDLVAVKDELYLEVDRDHNEVIISGGEIKRWDVRFKGGSDFIKFNGSGNLDKSFKLNQDYQIDTKTIELITNKVSKVSGKISGRGIIQGFENELSTYMEIFGGGIFAKIEAIPNPLTDISFKLIFEGEELFLETLKADYGQGNITAAGNVIFQVPFPKVNITGNIDNSYISFLNKSGVLINSNLRISGEKFPYSLSGHVSVIGGAVEDPIENFNKAKKENLEYERYIPKKEFEGRIDYIDFNIDFDFLQPVLFRNRLADAQFNGTGKILGTLDKPSLSGSLTTIPGISKFLFKGHEFLLSEGEIKFDGSEQINPKLNFAGNSQVNEYDIKLSISGTANELGIDLNSEPSLSKQDILSLLTLGYTADISKNLGEKERESVTTIGLGTLIVDQLRLNEGLNSSLGLKLSVLPEFSENENSLLQGKTGASDRASKLKSGTKVKLEKKISKKVDVSVSSTVGGSLDQKQEMNLNYNINKNISIEGVYEIKTTDEETNEDPESVGADIKWKWTF